MQQALAARCLRRAGHLGEPDCGRGRQRALAQPVGERAAAGGGAGEVEAPAALAHAQQRQQMRMREGCAHPGEPLRQRQRPVRAERLRQLQRHASPVASRGLHEQAGRMEITRSTR